MKRTRPQGKTKSSMPFSPAFPRLRSAIIPSLVVVSLLVLILPL